MPVALTEQMAARAFDRVADNLRDLAVVVLMSRDCAQQVFARLLAFSGFVAWQEWRERQLRSFCESVHVGMSVTNMLLLQRRYGIDESLLNPYDRDVLHEQTSDREAAFIGGYPGDPDFECLFRRDDKVVLSAEIVP